MGAPFLTTVSAITEITHLARSMRYILPTLSWMLSMGGLQGQGATVIRILCPIIHPLRKVLPLNVSSVFPMHVFSTADEHLIGQSPWYFRSSFASGSQVCTVRITGLLPQPSAGFVLMFSLAAACRTSWVPVFIVSSVIRWTYVRIANLLGYPVIWIPRMGDMTLHIS